MAIEIDQLREEISAPSGLTIETVRDEHGLADWVGVWLFPVPDAIRRRYLDVLGRRGVGATLPWRYYVGRLGGIPVATSVLFVGEGVAAVHHVVTLPEVRRRGIGSAMTRWVLREAHALGYRVGVLTASPLGIGVLDDPDATVRERAVRLLATWREHAPLTAVLHVLDDSHADVRAAALDALMPLIDRVVPLRLLALLDDPDPHVCTAARRVVGAAGVPLPATEVLAFFADPRRSDQVPACEAALQVLATLGTAPPISPLVAALHFPALSVSAAARDALVTLGQLAIPALREALADAQPHVRAYATQALWQLAEDQRPALMEGALGDLAALPYHCSDHYLQ